MSSELISKEESIKITIFSSVMVLCFLFFPYLASSKSVNLANPYYATALIVLPLVILISLGMLIRVKRRN